VFEDIGMFYFLEVTTLICCSGFWLSCLSCPVFIVAENGRAFSTRQHGTQHYIECHVLLFIQLKFGPGKCGDETKEREAAAETGATKLSHAATGRVLAG
jgi:hypothetical protein